MFDQTILQIWHIYASKYRRNPFRITLSSERDTTSQPIHAWKVSGSLGTTKKLFFCYEILTLTCIVFRRVLAFIICYKMCKGRTFTSLHKEWLIYSYQSYELKVFNFRLKNSWTMNNLKWIIRLVTFQTGKLYLFDFTFKGRWVNQIMSNLILYRKIAFLRLQKKIRIMY